MVCIIAVSKKGKLYKEFSSKYFMINHKSKYLEFQNSTVTQYIWYKNIGVVVEDGICYISIDM